MSRDAFVKDQKHANVLGPKYNGTGEAELSRLLQ
jgi:hypothetical protein